MSVIRSNNINNDDVTEVTDFIGINKRFKGLDSSLLGKGNQADVDSLTASLAESTQLKGTTQSLVFNTDGTVQQVQHVDSNGNVLRTDSFTYATNLITEVRTVGINTLTFKYHLDTLQTEVI